MNISAVRLDANTPFVSVTVKVGSLPVAIALLMESSGILPLKLAETAVSSTVIVTLPVAVTSVAASTIADCLTVSVIVVPDIPLVGVPETVNAAFVSLILFTATESP